MVRYIDADKTLQLMWDALYQYEDDIEKKNGLNITERLNVQNGFEIAHKAVADAPAEDVAPVIHAYWIGGDYGDWFCSECDSVLRFYGEPRHLRYCYRCGAKMNGEVNGG